MSGAATYGPDSGANGAEYGSYTTDGRPVSYAQLGQSPGSNMMPHGMLQQQMPMSGGQGGYLNPNMGEPTMRESVEGIPQVHMHQQHLANMQSLQGVPGGGMPQGMPQHLGGVMPQYALQAGMAMSGGQQFAGGGVPMPYYQMGHSGAPGYAQMATLVPDYRFGALPQYMHTGNEWEDEYDEGSGAVLYGNLEVKHRRRTTPEQLRVLEHYFAINPRPDNAMREYLASELGITKRNVQVWFQNRRAKIKQQEKAREAAAAESQKEQAAKAEAGEGGNDAKNETTPTPDANNNRSPSAAPANAGVTTPSGQGTPSGQPQVPSMGLQPHPPTIQTTPAPGGTPAQVPSRPSSSAGGSATQQPIVNLLPSADKIDMGRRVSIAGGDVASVELWAIKRRQQMGQTSPYPANLSPANSPMGMAAAARRNSQPYPTQLLTHHVGATGSSSGPSVADDSISRSALGSPKISPSAANGRTPGHLIFTALRNNSLRRASMPGGAAQLISTTAFTPPRVSSTYHSAESPSGGRQGGMRELSPIKDQDYEIDPALRVPMTFVTPPQNGMAQGGDLFNVPGATESSLSYTLNPGLPFTPNSPLPNPSFSFGGTPSQDSNPVPSLYGDKSQSGLFSAENDPNAVLMAWQRGRLGSIASVNSVATNGTECTATEYGSEADWSGFIPPGFDPDTRRASAPADLLHNIGLLGISGPSSQNPSPIRPSPLASGFPNSAGTMPSGNTYELTVPSGPVPGPQSAPIQPSSSSSSTLGGGPYLPASHSSPTQSAGGSQIASEGPSPVGGQLQINPQSLMMPPPPVPGQQQYQQAPDMGQQYASESSASLPPSFPNVPDPSAYSGLPSSSAASNSGETLNPAGNDFDLSFEFSADSDDKDFSFLSDFTTDNGSDTVNVFG